MTDVANEPTVHLIPDGGDTFYATGTAACGETVTDRFTGAGYWDVVTCLPCVIATPELAKIRGVKKHQRK